MIKFPHAFNFNGERLFINKTQYGEGGRTALQITDAEGTPYATLTVNIPDIQLRPGEFLIKTWSENKYIAEHIRRLGLFTDTNKRFKTGFVVGEIWELRT